MPSGFLNADIQMPDLTDAGKDVETRLKETQDYLYLLLENLRYTLNNLEPGNFNEAGLKAITDPINARIADADGRLTQLALTAEGLELSVQGLESQTTVYVNSNGLIVENGTGRQVFIGQGAVAADFFYGQKYYDSTGYTYMRVDPTTSGYSSWALYSNALNSGNTPYFKITDDLLSTNKNVISFYGSKLVNGAWDSWAEIGTFNPGINTFNFACNVTGVVATFGA